VLFVFLSFIFSFQSGDYKDYSDNQLKMELTEYYYEIEEKVGQFDENDDELKRYLQVTLAILTEMERRGNLASEATEGVSSFKKSWDKKGLKKEAIVSFMEIIAPYTLSIAKSR